MDLKVWFPLNGNYLSYGLQTYSDITYNGTLDAAGKTGSCYAFAQKYFRINGSMINGIDEFTIACWVYLTSTTYNIFTFETSNAYWQFALSNNYLRVRDTVTGATGTRKDLAITAIPQTTWTHVTVAYNKGSIKVYQDGVLKDTLTGNANAAIVSTTTVLCIGADPVNSTSTYPGNCKVNDFRVYEHALSQKEIKELARGLIVHYPLYTRESVLSKYSSVNWNQLAENGNVFDGIGGGGGGTDEKVKQNAITSSDSNSYPLLATGTTAPAGTAQESKYSSTKLNKDGDIIFDKTTKCSLQYDNTNLCLNFAFE